MADRTVSVRLQANIASYKAAMGQAAAETRKWESQLLKSARNNEQAFNTLGIAGVATGAAIALGLGKVVGASMEFEKQMSAVKAVSGASASEMERLGDAAMKAGADVELAGVTASSAAQAQAELVKAGVATADVLGGALKGSLSLAVAGNMDMAKSAEIAAQAMNIFKLEGADVGHVADVLAAAANKSAADVGSLGDGMRQAGLVAAQTGLDLETTVGTLSAFADRALVGSDAGTSLKTMLQRLTPQSAEAAALFQELGIQAFDAAGEFVGMAGLAGELQESLGGMSTEQRNAALNVLFGADAIRAANVLFELGAEGVQGYTDAVNDAGAASRMAATMTDNLAGDVEALGGAWESLMIDMGGNAQGTLRGTTQGLTNMVNGLAQMPEWAQSAALGVSGLTSAAGLLGGGVMLALPKVAAFQEAVGKMGPKAQLLGNGILRAGSLLAGPWGIALGVATAGLAAYLHSKGEAVAATNEFVAALDDETGALTGENRALTVRALRSRGAYDDAKTLAIGTKELTDAVLHGGAAYAELQARLMDLKTNGVGPVDDAAISLSNTIEAQRAIVENSAAQWETESAAMGNFGTTASFAAEQQMALSDEVAGGDAALSGMDSTLAGVAPTMEEVTTRAEAMEQAFASLGGTARSVDAAAISWEQSLADLRSALKGNNDTLDVSTKQGRENKGAILDTVDAMEEHLTALAESGASMSTLRSTFRNHISDFRATATEAGLTRAQINRLIRRYGLLPSQIMTNVQANTTDAERGLSRVLGYIQRINEEGIPYRVPAAVERGPDTFTSSSFSGAISSSPQLAPGIDYDRLAGAVKGGDSIEINVRSTEPNRAGQDINNELRKQRLMR